jgi:RNA polymerase sigma-70 factor, ECF subfamily
VTLGGDGESGRADDVALVEAHLAGDPAAFGELFRRHRDRLWAVALRTTGNPEDASDALQDALISAFRRAESFRGDAAVTTWLHRIVVNASLDRLRRRKVRAADPLPDDLEERAARGAVVAGTDQGADLGPEAHVLAGERRHRVLAALEELPPDQRAALVLVDMEGYPVAEAAGILEVPTGTVKSRCARGRARLAVLLADLGPPTGTDAGPAASHPGDPPGGRHQPGPEHDHTSTTT